MISDEVIRERDEYMRCIERGTHNERRGPCVECGHDCYDFGPDLEPLKSSPIRDALAELLRLKDLKDADPEAYEKEDKETAWAEARRALNQDRS